jgi:hypothetical protein
MPSPTTSQLPKPKSWDEFEDIVADLMRELWKDNFLTRNGRSGQKQYGVDIFGQPDNLDGRYAGVQCKLTDKLTIQTIDNEVEEAQRFRPLLAVFIIATSMSRDAVLQEIVRTHNWPFRVHVMFWEDISLALSGFPQLLEKHFPGWIKTTMREDQVRQLIFSSEPSDYSYEASTGQFFLKRDTDLRIVLDRTNDNLEYSSFDEPWVRKFPDPHGYRQEVNIYYRSTLIMKMLLVNVDGGRYTLPLPKSADNLIITPFQYHVGKIINFPPGGYDYDDGLRIAGFKIVE